MLDFSVFQRPRLRVVAATPGLAPGGAEMWLGTLVRSAQTVKYTAIITASNDNSALQSMFHGVPVIFSGQSHDADETARVATEAIIKAAKEHGADLIVYWGFVPMPGLAALTIPVVHVSHSSGIEKTAWHEVHMVRYGDSRANFLVGVSESATAFFNDKLRAREKVYVVHNGADVERTRPFIGRDDQRKIWGIPKSAKVMLFLGRLSREKCPETALDAMQHLGSDWWLVLYGWGVLEEQLVLAAMNSPAKDRILFPQPRLAGLGDVYAASDVVVIPSITEAFPMVLIEAWHAGIAVVCSEFSTIKEIESEYAKGDELAWHVPCPPTPKELAVAVELAAVGDDRIAEAQRLAVDNFSATAMIGRWEQLFYQCVREWQSVGVNGMMRKGGGV